MGACCQPGSPSLPGLLVLQSLLPECPPLTTNPYFLSDLFKDTMPPIDHLEQWAGRDKPQGSSAASPSIFPEPPSALHLDLRFFRDCDGRLPWMAHGCYCTQGVDGRSCPRGQLGDSGSGLLSFPYWVTLQPLSIDLTGPPFLICIVKGWILKSEVTRTNTHFLARSLPFFQQAGVQVPRRFS